MSDLTAAELAAIEARWMDLAAEAANIHIDAVAGTTNMARMLILVGNLLKFVADDPPRLLSALRTVTAERDEARALVDGLADVEPVCYHSFPDVWECLACKATAEKRGKLTHAPDCAWQAARDALARWRGDDAEGKLPPCPHCGGVMSHEAGDETPDGEPVVIRCCEQCGRCVEYM